jgi:hypothetical protein
MAGKRSMVPTFKDDLAAYLSAVDNSLEEAMARDIASLLITRIEDEISGIGNLELLDPRFITCFTVKRPD